MAARVALDARFDVPAATRALDAAEATCPGLVGAQVLRVRRDNALIGFYLLALIGTFFSVAMVGFAGAAILYDTSNVLHHYPEDRYVGAALQLFASVALMFFYVLRLFMAARD